MPSNLPLRHAVTVSLRTGMVVDTAFLGPREKPSSGERGHNSTSSSKMTASKAEDGIQEHTVLYPGVLWLMRRHQRFSPSIAENAAGLVAIANTWASRTFSDVLADFL